MHHRLIVCRTQPFPLLVQFHGIRYPRDFRPTSCSTLQPPERKSQTRKSTRPKNHVSLLEVCGGKLGGLAKRPPAADNLIIGSRTCVSVLFAVQTRAVQAAHVSVSQSWKGGASSRGRGLAAPTHQGELTPCRCQSQRSCWRMTGSWRGQRSCRAPVADPGTGEQRQPCARR